MEIPNNSSEGQIPNSIRDAGEGGAAVLRELTGGFSGEVTAVRAPSWVLEHAMPNGEPLFVSDGPPERIDFSDEVQLDFYGWLSGAEALDVWRKPAWPESQLRECLVRFGAITLPQTRLIHGTFRLGPGGRFVGPDGGLRDDRLSVQLLAAAARASEDVPSQYSVDATAFFQALAELRLALLLAVSRANGTDWWRDYIERDSGPFSVATAQLVGTLPGRRSSWDKTLTRLQLWFVHGLLQNGLTVVPMPGESKLALAFRPRSAYERLWVTLAVTAGVLDLPWQVDGLFRCEYRRCSRWFFSDRLAVKGDNRFCSVRCGKSFHAAAATKRRRTSEKQRSSEHGD